MLKRRTRPHPQRISSRRNKRTNQLHQLHKAIHRLCRVLSRLPYMHNRRKTIQANCWGKLGVVLVSPSFSLFSSLALLVTLAIDL
jgi:hypothetical protein